MTATHAFDPKDHTRVRHSKYGLWDVYEQEEQSATSVTQLFLQPFTRVRALLQNFHYIYVLLGILRAVPRPAIKYCASTFLTGVILPTISLWIGGQLLAILQAAQNGSNFDLYWFGVVIAFDSVSSTFSGYLQGYAYALEQQCGKQLRTFFVKHILHAHIRLDIPTSANPVVERQLQSASGSADSAWRTLNGLLQFITTSLTALSAILALGSIAWQNPIAAPLAVACLLSEMTELVRMLSDDDFFGTDVWAATCKDPRYVKLHGYQQTAQKQLHKQEVLAFNMGKHLEQRCANIMQNLGSDAVTEFDSYELGNSRRYARMMTWRGVQDSLIGHLPSMVLAVSCVRAPAEIPLLLSAYTLMNRAVTEVRHSVFSMANHSASHTRRLTTVKASFEIAKVENTVRDGTEPFPENLQDTAQSGIEIEFRSVSFKYPGAGSWALKDISFKIPRGALAVIVGFNGSGKSTVLKLLTRLYDPTEGQIFIDGRDIKTLRIEDLRETVAVLFQDYTLFPLSVRENVALGHPQLSHDDERVDDALRLAGVDFEERLQDGFDSYLTRPVKNQYANLPDGTETIFGMKVDFESMGGDMSESPDINLSGGQQQKIAVARTMMRMTSAADKVGLILFDEPSASMDPVAEHALFETLRDVRKGKTMVFSTHRYGNLVQHGNVIIFMKNARVTEIGTHEELIKLDGGYAEMWKLQAQAFLQK